MNENKTFVKVLRAVNGFLIFFVIVAFVVSCCMMLFLTTMAKSMNMEFTSEGIQLSAKLTMLNVVIITLVLTVCDAVRRKITVDKPVKRIISFTEKMMQGDFSARIPISRAKGLNDGFVEIADCFNKMASELSSTETLSTDFVANVSHELKTPLSVIQNYATLLQQRGLSEEKRIEYSREIASTSRKLATLITNILRLNKLENQAVAPSLEKYDLSEQVCECLLGFEEAWEKKRLNLETDIEDGVLINSDKEMMSLVWNNLFSNAIKFTEPEGTVFVSVKAKGERAIVEVADTGCGISAETGKHIFDKFYQGDTSHATQGNGLGLSLVKRVIDITGSDISVQSELNKGTRFTVKMRRA